MLETLLKIFIIVIGLAVVLQAGVMLALYLSVKQTSAHLETMLSELHKRAVPLMEKMGAAGENLAAASATLRTQMERVDTTLSDVLDRTRLQVIRADELMSRTLDRVEETTEMVQHTVISPVRQFAGLFSGITAGVGTFFGRRHATHSEESEDEELFI